MRSGAGFLVVAVVFCGVSHSLAFTSLSLGNAQRCLTRPGCSVNTKPPNSFVRSSLRSAKSLPVVCQNSNQEEGEKKEAGCTGDVFLLSFDGVLCDSVRETSRIAFEVARELWPEEMGKVGKIKPREAGVRKSWVEYDWQEYEQEDEEAAGMPRWLQEKLRQVGPMAASPADFVLAARLCVDEALAAKRSSSGQRPLSVGEIVENWEEMRDLLTYKYGVAPSEVEAAFDIQQNRGWAGDARDLFHPGMAAAMLSSKATLRIIAPRPVELTEGMLAAVGVALPPGSVLQVGEGGVADAAANTLQTMPKARVQVVTDSLRDLRAMASDLRLANAHVTLSFATWGLNSPKQLAAVAGWPRVKALSEAAELQALLLRGEEEGEQEEH